MISRAYRFHGQKAIEHIYRKGRPARGGFMGAKALPSNKDYHLAVVVSRKVNKSAVARNRIRRRLFEQFRLIRKARQAPIGYDIILSVYQDEITDMPATQLRTACEKLLRQIENSSQN